MKQLPVLAFALLCTLYGNAQSLVLNYDMESHNVCPQGLFNILDCDFCSAPSDGSPDYFNACAPTVSQVSVPNNVFGDQQAHSGDGYCGFWAYIDGFPYREYILMQLGTPMEVGKTYDIKFYISLGGIHQMGCNGIGMWLSPTAPLFLGDQVLPVTPQILYPGVITDTTNWVEVGGPFVADQAYSHLVIGNFFDDAILQTDTIGTPPVGAYFYVDDVMINEQPDTIIPPQPVVIIIPDVFTPTGPDGANDTFVIQDLPDNSHIVIYNRWGNKIYENANYQNDWDGESHSDGVYYYILNTPDGKDYHGTVTKI